MRRLLSQLLAALLLTTITLYAAETPKEEVELRIYDVAELTSVVPDYPGPDVTLSSRQVVAGQPPAGAAAPRQAASPTCASLADMIRQRISPDQWDPALGTSIEEMGGRLVIMQRPSIHSSIAHLLKAFSSQSKAQVVVKSMLIPADEIPDQTFFDMEALNKLCGGDAATSAIAAPRLLCCNKQRVHQTSGTELMTVSDIDISGDTYDPLMTTLLDGYVFDVRPIMSEDHATVDVELRLTYNANVKTNKTVLGTAAALRAPVPLPQAASSSSTTENENGKQKNTTSTSTTVNQMLNSQYASGFEVDRPSMDSGVIRTDLTVPSGKWVLAGTLKNADSKSSKKSLLVFISAEPAEPE